MAVPLIRIPVLLLHNEFTSSTSHHNQIIIMCPLVRSLQCSCLICNLFSPLHRLWHRHTGQFCLARGVSHLCPKNISTGAETSVFTCPRRIVLISGATKGERWGVHSIPPSALSPLSVSSLPLPPLSSLAAPLPPQIQLGEYGEHCKLPSGSAGGAQPPNCYRPNYVLASKESHSWA